MARDPIDQDPGINRDGRYAPSPTGPLHLGNLRTALLAWLFARKQGAGFALRIEDLDRERSRREHEAGQLGDLESLGLDWDGEPLRQSERADRYAEAIEQLRSEGLVYECWCSRREIREAASAPHLDRDELPEGAYPGTCAGLSAADRERRAAESGRPPALRVRADGARVGFTDRLRGPQAGAVDDFVLRRGDGTPAYNLAVVVDDAAQGIGEVVRGSDLLDSTPRQIWLGERLGLEPVASWVHVPLVLGDDGAPLSKRHGDVTLADRLALGEGPDEVRGRLAASLGLCGPGESPAPGDLLERFDPPALPLESGTLP